MACRPGQSIILDRSKLKKVVCPSRWFRGEAGESNQMSKGRLGGVRGATTWQEMSKGQGGWVVGRTRK